MRSGTAHGAPLLHMDSPGVSPLKQVSPTRRGRLVDRHERFGQSHGTFKIERDVSRAVRWRFYVNDWFHTLVNTRSYRIFAAVVLSYLLIFVIFALLYMAASTQEGCMSSLYPFQPAKNHTSQNGTWVGLVEDDREPSSLGLPYSRHFYIRFMRALFFSLETMMTIGYGVDDPYFGDCPLMLLLIMAQSLVGIFASSVLFGIVLTRVSRADQRACTVAFSERAIVRAAYNELYLVLRVTEMRKHQLTQAYVHAYSMCDSGDVIGDTASATEGASVHALPMELVHPTGEMMLVTPCFIVHRLDAQSPLLPPGVFDGLDDEVEHEPVELPSLLRALQAQPSVLPPPPARSSISSPARSLRQHLPGRWGASRANARAARHSASEAARAPDASSSSTSSRRHSMPDLPPLPPHLSMPELPSLSRGGGGAERAGGHSGGGDADLAGAPTGEGQPTEALQHRLRRRLALVKQHMINCNAEVLLLLEGVDPTTSSTVQARQSYTVDDICWDATFVPCARRQPHGGIRIDFDKLHAVLPLGSLLPASSLMRMPTHDNLQGVASARHAALQPTGRSSGTGDATEEFDERVASEARVN